MRELPRGLKTSELVADGNRQKPPRVVSCQRNLPSPNARQVSGNQRGSGEREDRAGSSVSTEGNATDSEEEDRNCSTEVTDSSSSDSTSDSEGQRQPLEPISEEATSTRKRTDDEENGESWGLINFLQFDTLYTWKIYH